MIEIFEFMAAYWNKSKEDWQKNRHRLIMLFAFVLVAYLVLEVGSYIFTSQLNHAKTIDTIRTKFIDKRVDIADQVIRNFYKLKENTRLVILGIDPKHFNNLTCQKLVKNTKIIELESDLFISGSNLRFFFGNEITNEFTDFISWYSKNIANCFKNITNSETTIDKKVLDIRNKIWNKMYPPELIKGIR